MKKKTPKTKNTKSEPKDRLMMISNFIMKEFKKTTQNKALSKVQKELSARTFCVAMNTLAPVISLQLTNAEWERVFELVNENLSDYKF
jgi:hypothetical protein